VDDETSITLPLVALSVLLLFYRAKLHCRASFRPLRAEVCSVEYSSSLQFDAGEFAQQRHLQLTRQRPPVACHQLVKPGSPKTVYDFIKDAHGAGVKFYCCSPNLDLFDMTEADLIPECEGIVGGAKVIEEIMEDDDARVLTY